MGFAGRIAVVTGAARGIGRAVATHLASEGATIVLADIDGPGAEKTARELGTIGPPVWPIPLDVTDPAQIAATTTLVLDRFGRLDILVNNAGILGKAVSVRDLSDEEWHRVLQVNLSSVFYCCRAVLPAMVSRGYGRIVSIASVAGKEGNPNGAAYSVSKAGVICLTKSLAKEVARAGITVNCVTPATTATDMVRGWTAEQKADFAGKSPMARFATPEEIAAVVGFLASDAASFVTGAAYDVSGGRSDY